MYVHFVVLEGLCVVCLKLSVWAPGGVNTGVWAKAAPGLKPPKPERAALCDEHKPPVSRAPRPAPPGYARGPASAVGSTAVASAYGRRQH